MLDFGMVFSVVFLGIAFFAMLFGALKARKKMWQWSVVRMIQTALSAVLAALASAAIVSKALGSVLGTLDLGELSDILTTVPSMQEAIIAVAGMIVAPIIFLFVYVIIRAFIRIFTRLLTRLLVKLTVKKAEAQPEAAAEATEAPETEASEAEPMTKKEAKKAKKKAKKDAKKAKKAAKKAKKKAKKAEFKLAKGSWISALCGAACGLITLCVMAIPMVGTMSVVSDVAAAPIRVAAAEDESGTMEMVADALDAAGNNAGTVTVKALGGGLVYDIMTTYKVGGESATLRHEAHAVGVTVDALVTMSEENVDKQVRADKLRSISGAFKKTTLVPVLLSEFISAAADNWEKGEAFYDIEMPSISEELDPIMVSLVGSMKNANSETVKQDAETLFEILAVLVEGDVVNSFTDDPMSVFADEAVTADILFRVLENERLCIIVDGLTDYGITTIMDAMGTPENTNGLYYDFLIAIANISVDEEEKLVEDYSKVFDTYGLRVDKELVAELAAAKIAGEDVLALIAEKVVADQAAFAEKTEIITLGALVGVKAEIVDRKAEAKNLAHLFATILDIKDGLDGDVEDVLHQLGPILDAFSSTATIGKTRTALILKAILQSDNVHDSIGFSVIEANDAADSMINSANNKGYTTVMNSLHKIVVVLDAVANEEKDTDTAVKELLADLDSDSAEVISTITKPNVVVNYGVNEQSAKPVSELVSDTFTNLANAKDKGLSDEDIERESAAVSKMMNVLMTTGDAKRAFGEGSRTGTSAEEFVATVLDSTVMIDTVMSKVYVDGSDTPTLDPMNSQSTMDEDEQIMFVDALNERYQGSDKSEQTEKEMIALASLINVEIAVVDGAFQIVDTPVVLPA